MSDLSPALKPVDCWWTVAVIDPAAMRVLPLLLRLRRATPNVVTGVAFVVGIASFIAFAGSWWVAGALLYELRFFLDCLDGKIARVRRLSSPAGAMFDRLADMVTVPAIYGVIGWRLADAGHLPARLALLTASAAVLVSGVEAVLEVVRLKEAAAPAAPAPVTGAVVGWARRHRLTLRPWTVEAETVGLFLGPLLLRGRALGGLELAMVAVYAVFVLVDLVFIFRTVRGKIESGKAVDLIA